MKIENEKQYRKAMNELDEIGSVPLCGDVWEELYGARDAELRAAVNDWIGKHKTKSASKVLSLMDSEEDGPYRYHEFVSKVSKEDGISIEDLNRQLTSFV